MKQIQLPKKKLAQKFHFLERIGEIHELKILDDTNGLY
jgi:hypothetical protein